MSRISIHISPPPFFQELSNFVGFLRRYIRQRGYSIFSKFEVGKDVLVDLLYKKRGKYARPFLHFGTIGLIFTIITLGPIILSQSDEEMSDGVATSGLLSTASAYENSFSTLQAEEVRQYRGGEITTHAVQEGETLSSIAQRYSLQITTIIWENDLTENTKLKPGQELRILPVDGVRHQVKRGETLESVGKKYGLEGSQAQTIVDYPFNEFLNNETFELAIGQYLIIPDGVIQDSAVQPSSRPASQVPVAVIPGAGTGAFVWPAAGSITQGYRFYHKAIDIANRGGGSILAADTGTVIAAGWDGSGYGNRVIIDHGNGFVTLYGHLSVVQVSPGQKVNRGSVIGQMGSSGRSTGTHLHFEIRKGDLLNPMSYLN